MANRQRRVAVRADDVRVVVRAVFASERAGEPDISVAMVNDAVMRQINRDYLDHDWATDSIAFSFDEDPSPDELRGEVVVSAETALREANERGVRPEHELLLYVAHGTLHLLGWDDDTPEHREAMNAHAADILRTAGVAECFSDPARSLAAGSEGVRGPGRASDGPRPGAREGSR